ncbi:hypothetical protein LguiA_024447 [Lonicera macranthoides]
MTNSGGSEYSPSPLKTRAQRNKQGPPLSLHKPEKMKKPTREAKAIAKVSKSHSFSSSQTLYQWQRDYLVDGACIQESRRFPLAGVYGKCRERFIPSTYSRRITRSWTMIMPLWSAYFLADWVSNLAVGLISGKQSGHNVDLLAFWAPFFLVHLGKPNKPWIPTTLMLFNGVIKCYEWTRSLYLASFDSVFDFLETFKGLVVNQTCSFVEHNQSLEFFLKRTAKDAFRMVEVELSFIYDVLYTRIPLVHCKVGYLSRSFSLCSVVVALVLFNSLDKNEFVFIDVKLTYTLLISALTLDIIAVIMLVFTNWTVVAQNKLAAHEKWSESVATYSLHPHSRIREKIYGFLYLFLIDEVIYVKHTHFTKDLRNFIFEELKTKSALADDVQDICSSRVGNDVNQHRDFSKLLSDYMLYLLVTQPQLMSAVTGIVIVRFQDTCASAEKILGNEKTKLQGSRKTDSTSM